MLQELEKCPISGIYLFIQKKKKYISMYRLGIEMYFALLRFYALLRGVIFDLLFYVHHV